MEAHTYTKLCFSRRPMKAFTADNLCTLPNTSHSFGVAGVTNNPPDLFYSAQQHGAHVIQVGTNEVAGTIASDAIFTRTSRPIAVITADCLPILVGSSNDTFVAAIHGGWKGLMAGIIENSFNSFRESGISLKHLHVAIGPAIQPCCYEVSHSLIEKIESTHGHLWQKQTAPWSVYRHAAPENKHCAPATTSHDKRWLNLPHYCLYLLKAAGLDKRQIQTINTCTYCSPDTLGSYRRRTHFCETKTFQYSWIRINSTAPTA